MLENPEKSGAEENTEGNGLTWETKNIILEVKFIEEEVLEKY